MKVKVKYHDIVTETEKAILFLICDDEIWFPKYAVEFCKGRYFTCDRTMADEKGIMYTAYHHIPKPIIPIYKQDAIDGLIYTPRKSN